MVTPIARLTSEYLVVVVPANSPHKTMGDLVKAFRADPGKVSWNGGSAGGSDHILVGLIARAIAGGHVTAGVAGLGEFAEHIKGGRMRALAVSGPGKIDNIPSLKEQGIDVELGNWRGVFGAPGITPAQRDALVGAVRTATESKEWKDTLAKMGWEGVFLGGDAYKAFLEEDTKRISGILDSLGLRK